VRDSGPGPSEIDRVEADEVRDEGSILGFQGREGGVLLMRRGREDERRVSLGRHGSSGAPVVNVQMMVLSCVVSAR
jgi:hypothetical protein